jgi:hypothetical protein
VRANTLLGEDAALEMLRLKTRVEELQSEIGRLRTEPPGGTEHLARGDERLDVRFESKELNLTFSTTWNEIFKYLGPHLMTVETEDGMRFWVKKLYWSRAGGHLTAQHSHLRIGDLGIVDEDFQTIKIQLRALGLIEMDKSGWVLTRYGEALVVQLAAVRSQRAP